MMNVTTRLGVASGPLCALLLLMGCRKESDRARWDVDVLAPLVTSSLTIRDLIPDSLLSTYADGQVSLFYRSDLFNVDLDTLLEAPDTAFVYAYSLPVSGPLNFPAGINFFSQNDVQRFNLGDVALRRLILREGRLELEMTNMVTSGVIGQLELPGVIFPDGGTVLSTSVGPGTPTNPAFSTAQRDLAGSSFDLRGPLYDEVNTLQTILGAQLDPNGPGASVTNLDSVIIKASYVGLVPQYAKGYFGSRVVTVDPETSTLGLFDAVVAGTLDLDEATLRITVENGLGMDIQIALQQFSSVNTRTGQTIELEHSILQGPINLNRALDLGNGFTPSLYQNTLDVGNSNIDLFLENLPDQLGYALELRLNPLGDVSSGNDFLYFESRIRAGLELEVPLRLIANSLTLESFASPELPGTEEGHALRKGTLKLFTTNGFPMQAELELAIVDAMDQVLSVIPIEGSIPAGILGPNGLVGTPSEGELMASLSPDQVDLLYGDTRIRIRAALTTSSQSQHLRILDYYALDVQVTAAFNYLVNGDE